MQRMRRPVDSKKLEFQKKLEGYAEKGQFLYFPISTSLKDGRTPIFDNGVVQVPLDAAWNPPIGESREVVVIRTRRGRFYLKPANLEKLPKGEYDPDSPRDNLSAVLREGRNRSLYFRMPSGQILIPLNERAWRAHGAGKLIGREIELIGWPRGTCFVVMPRHGLDAIGATTKISVSRAKQLEAQFEAEMGIVRVEVKSGEKIPVFANQILAISADATLTLPLLKSARATTLRSVNAATADMSIAGNVLTAESYKIAAIAAYKALEGLIKKGVTSMVSLEEAAPEIEEHLNGKAEEQIPADDGIVSCPTCGRKNCYRSESGSHEKARCGVCKKPLFPEPVAAKPIVPAEPVVLDIAEKPRRQRRPKAERPKDPDEGQEDKLEAEAQAKAVSHLKKIIGGPIKNGRIVDLVSKTNVRDAESFLGLVTSNIEQVREICNISNKQLATAVEQAQASLK